jgi:hypothetical protein
LIPETLAFVIMQRLSHTAISDKESLIDWLFTVLRPTQEYFTYMETSPLLVKGCEILAYARRSGPLNRDSGIFIVPHLLWYGASVFFGLIRRTAQFSRLLRHTRGCGGSILTRILTGPHSVASYDMQRSAEDLFLPKFSTLNSIEDHTTRSFDWRYHTYNHLWIRWMYC